MWAAVQRLFQWHLSGLKKILGQLFSNCQMWCQSPQEYVEKEGFVGKIDTYAGNYYTEKPTPSWTSYPNYQNLKLIEGEHYVTLSETRLNTEQNSFLVSIDLRC